MKRINQILAISFLIATFAVIASAQSFRGTLVGRVTDSAGAGVPNATVTVTHAATNQVRTVTTNDSGEYVAAQLQPGEYSVKIDATGFKSTINQNIVLQTDETRRVNVTLDVGSVNETVTVEGEAPVINSETPEKGEVIVQRQVQELPLNVRDFTDLAKLVPGIYARPTEDDQGQGLASAGTRTDSTNFILDGVSNRDDRNGAVGVNTSVDSIQEFKVSTSTYSAEYGRMAGAQISVVSKSGTNRYSGSAFEFVRNNFFDANNYFTPVGEQKTLKRHQFGGTFGGPLPFINFGKGDNIYDSGKDKMFFFASFEQLREVRSQSQRTVAPNADWARGDFRNVLADGVRIMCLRKSSNPLRPTKVECPTPNVIPLGPVANDPDLLYASPISLALLDYLPRANDPNSNDGFTYSLISNTLPRNLFSLKVDRKINSANSFYFRYSLDNRDAYQPQAGRFNYPGFLRVWDYNNTSIAFGDTHIFTPSLINDFRVGFGTQDRKTLPENNDQDYVSLLGIPGLPSASEPSVWGFPAIRIDGFPDTGDSANVPFSYLYKNISLANSVTWIKGNHNWKFGVDVLRPNYVESDIRNVRGDFRFRGRFTNPANQTSNGVRSFADFLYGLPDSTQRQIGTDPADLVAWQSAFYIQDNWRVANWLTLNLGVRYDYTPYLYEKSNLISNFIPELGISACAGGEFRDDDGNLICVDGASLGLPRALVETDKNNWAPRVGFALKPFKDDKTVIRGGAGIYYSTETINPARQMLALNYPYLNRQSFNRSSTANILQLTFDDPFPDDRLNLQGVTTPQGIPTDSQTPEVYQFNLTLERELAKDLALEIGYVGSQGRHLGVRYNLNYQYPNSVVGQPPIRAYPALGDITYQAQVLNSTYNAMQVTLRRRAKNGLTLLASYTFGKAMDQNSNTNNSTTGSQRNPQDIHDFSQDWGLADFHRTHQFSGSFNYDLPFGRGRQFFSGARGWADVLVGGWQMNGIVTLLSGRPFTPVFSSLDTASGRPDLVGDPMANVPDGLYFNPDAFARPVATAEDPNLFGNAGRNIVIGPGYQNFDISLFKNFRLAEKTKLQLRWELFNLLNHPNFQVPQHLLGTSDTGKIRSTAGEAREMQFAVRLTF
jgi:outer membrane receptor protein involved in Fe transport